MLDWINHHGTELLVAQYLFSAAVQSLPKVDNCSPFYQWVYSFFHLVAGNLGAVKKALDTPQDVDRTKVIKP